MIDLESLKSKDEIKIEKVISVLSKNVDKYPENARKKVDEILLENSEFLVGHNLKIELLKIKAKAFFYLGEIEEVRKTYSKNNYDIFQEVRIGDDDEISGMIKKKLYIQNIEELLGYYAQIPSFNEKNLVDEEILEFEKKFEYEAVKLKGFGEESIAVYYYGLFLRGLGKYEESVNFIEASAFLGNQKAIDEHTDFLINYFLEGYAASGDKEKFIDNHLEDFEDNFYQFIDKYKRNENEEREETIYGGNNFLYKKLGEFYEKIGFLKESLQLFQNTHELAKKNGHKENEIFCLEKFGDLNVDNNGNLHYKEAIKLLTRFNNNHEDTIYILTNIARIMLKMGVSDIIVGEKKIRLEEIYMQLAGINPKYYLNLAEFYDINDDILSAFQLFLLTYQDDIENSEQKLLLFLNNNLIGKDRNIINKIKKNGKINDDEIIKIFKIIQSNIYVYSSFQYIGGFIQGYNPENKNSNLLLYAVLSNLFERKLNELEQPIYFDYIEKKEKLFQKIKDFKQLSYIDVNFIKSILEPETNINNYQYSYRIERKK